MTATTAIPKTMHDVAMTYLESRVVYNALTDCMVLQPELDPEAGYGIFQIPTMLLSLGLETVQMQNLIERLEYKPIRLYVLMRCLYMGGLTREELLAFIEGTHVIDLKAQYRRLLTFVPKFQKRGVVSRLA